MSLSYYSAKDPGEVIVLSVNWVDVLGAETISSASWAITNLTTPAEDTTAMKSGAIDTSGAPTVRQKVIGGTAGCAYLHRCTVITSGGRTLTQGVQQTVSLGA